MDAIKAACELFFSEGNHTWANFVAIINAFLTEIFGYVAKEEGWDA